jgi:peptidoglycan glycosyltransferase
MTSSLRRLSAGLLAIFAIIALSLSYWTLIRGIDLVTRDDNPRRVLAEQQIQRGQILDRSGTVLAETIVDPEDGSSQRVYTYPSAAPVVGYYSLRYGVGGIESAYDDQLRGGGQLTYSEAILQDLLHRQQVGSDVQISLDIDVQQAVNEILEGYTGAVVVIHVPDGQVLALASQPTFDPATLDENWEALSTDPGAPLLNRATQGLYQPGESLQSVILGAALNNGIASSDEQWRGAITTAVDGKLFPCAADVSYINTLGGAYVEGCPEPFRQLAVKLGARRLETAIADFGLSEPPPFTLPTEATDPDAFAVEEELALTGIGQSSLTVSPLQMALVAASFADHGQMPPLQLVLATRKPGAAWQLVAADGLPRGTLSRTSADTIEGLMLRSVDEGASQMADVSGFTVAGHTGLAMAGPEGALNAWFIGYSASNSDEAIAVAVLLEDTPDAGEAARIGGLALAAAFNAIP